MDKNHFLKMLFVIILSPSLVDFKVTLNVELSLGGLWKMQNSPKG